MPKMHYFSNKFSKNCQLRGARGSLPPAPLSF